MRHFGFLDDADRQRLFHRAPEDFDAHSDPAVLASALGATLYSPATRPRLADDIALQASRGTTSMVICLEDAIPDHAVPEGERNAVEQLRRVAAAEGAAPPAPLLFVRVRNPYQIAMLVDRLGDLACVLTGFVLPKFTPGNGAEYLDQIDAASDRLGRHCYAMPVMESPEIGRADTRVPVLAQIRDLLDRHREHILAVRIGATDLSGQYGLRRSPEHTVYDIRVIAAVIADVVNLLGQDDGGYVVTGPVWEYFSSRERIFKTQLRESPFVNHHERTLRAELLAEALDGLIREVVLDRANGLTGKSVIHPSHVAAVNALTVVSHEEYLDASDILDTGGGGGVASSAYGNKMNESKPHSAWARRTMLRARAFGVAREDVSFVDVLAASLHQ